jgi:hypothetical protein
MGRVVSLRGSKPSDPLARDPPFNPCQPGEALTTSPEDGRTGASLDRVVVGGKTAFGYIPSAK